MELTALDLDLTRGCNMNCSHCFADAHTVMPNELRTEEYLDLLDQAAAHKATLTRVSWGLGGEALTRRDLFTLLDHAHALGLPQVLTTNGLLVTETIAERLAATEARISISIDGATDATHEALRKIPGSRGMAIRAIRRLKGAGAHVGFNTTLTKHNIHELQQLLDLGRELEVDHISLGNIMPFGRALDMPEMILDDDDYRHALEVAKDNFGYPVPVHTFDGVLDMAFNLGHIVETRKFTPKRTSAGRGKVVVRPDGEVWPCQLLPMNCGNVRGQTLDEVLASPVFADVLRMVEDEEKRTDVMGCGGGCACTYIMNNESDQFKGSATKAWKEVGFALPDEVAARLTGAGTK